MHTSRDMRSARLVGALVSISAAAIAASSGCGNGAHSTMGGPDAGGNDGTVKPDTSVDAGDEYVLVPFDGAAPKGPPRVPVYAKTLSKQVYTADLMFASGEMQTSGEPFASLFAGRNLGDYDRAYLPVDMYILNNNSSIQPPIPVKDLFGFSTAVESYEYSKMYMNMVIEETTAGVSLAYGPLTEQEPGSTALAQLQQRAFELLSSAGTDVGGFATLPAPTGNPANYLGFPGLWPEFAPFKDFNPAMTPTQTVLRSCSYQGGYGGVSTLGEESPAYECDYNTTHLTNPQAQIDPILTPATFGYTVWKEALWGIDFAGRVHDSAGTQVNAVQPSDMPLIGTVGNTVQGTNPPGLAVGSYIGSSPIEGMWGLMMIADMDNLSEWMISSLMTSDGATLSGFPAKAQALAYDYPTTPLLWFPNAITVTQDYTVVPYPPITGMTITDGSSSSEALSSLLLGNALFFGMTDPRNTGVGQRIGLLACFDGAPFAAWSPPPSGIPDGQDCPHDRALSMIRVAFIDLDRIHADPNLGVLTDTAQISAGTITRGTSVTTTTLAHSIIGMFQTFLSLNSAITQYGGANPDPSLDANGILNGLPITPPGVTGTPPTFSRRVRDVFTTNVSFLMNTLTKSDGTGVNGATLAPGSGTTKVTPLTSATTLDTQAAALRALIVGYLATGDTTYFARAQAVARSLIGPAFYSAPARLYRGVANGADNVMMAPQMFAWLQSSLRESYKTIFVPGDPALDRNVLQDRIARVDKLYLNGWDDLNGDQTIQYPKECLAGRMQQGEQALTGELGRDSEGNLASDRDQDCVLNISFAKTASTLASQVYFCATGASCVDSP
jgi:hypothetical protein